MASKEKKRIILVDDDVDLLRLLTAFLESKGFEMKTFEKGTEARDYLLSEKNLKSASLLILDRLLPDMDGIDILKAVAKQFPTHPPVLILSMLSAEKDVLAGLKGGAVDYITKPFSMPILFQKVQGLIDQ